MSKKKVVIIGAGPAGLAAGYTLAKEGIDVEVFEASELIGGMSASIDLWDQRVDLGPHRFFSKEPMINDFFHELVKEDYTVVDRLTRIYYRNRFFYYPLKLGNVLKNLPFGTIVRILFDYAVQRVRPIKDPKNFEEWVTNRFGKKLYTIFFKNYTEKLWGIRATEIDADWAAQRIKTLSLIGAVKNAIVGGRGNKHKTLVDQFNYPKNGTGTIYERAAEAIEAMGGKVHRSTPVKRVVESNKKVKGVELADGSFIEADEVISTMPINKLIDGLDSCTEEVKKASDELLFRNTILVYLKCESVDLFEDNWIYVHSPDVELGRITNFRNWCPSLYGDQKNSILCLEYWAFEEDELWTMDNEKLGEIGTRDLRRLGLAGKDVEVSGTKVIRVPKCYPVYQTGYKESLQIIESHLDSYDHMTVIGRYGAFKYNNQDHSILMGILASRKIAHGEMTNLWEINTDTEYQEDGEIKDVLRQ